MYSANNAFISTWAVILSLSVASIAGLPFGNSRIVGGKNATIGQFPYQVSLRYKMSLEFEHGCGGTILSERFVMTAAHCVEHEKIDHLQVFVGAQSKHDGQIYELQAIKIHEEYYGAGRATKDIAIIKLKSSIEFSEYVAPIKLNREFIVEEKAVLSGWGFTNIDDEPEEITLQYAWMNTLSYEHCIDMLNRKPDKASIDEFFTLCAFADKVTANKGDSGSPLVYNNTLIGITAWTPTIDDTFYPTVFTRVSKFVDWVDNVIAMAT